MQADQPLIRKTPGVCGGDACVGKRRITVWMLVSCRRMGISDERLKTQFCTTLFTQAELDAAWEYYEHNREETDNCIRENDEDEDEGDPSIHTFR